RAGEKRRGNTVGFALTILQRRLASSPEAIYQSLRRRRDRLEKRLREEENARRGMPSPPGGRMQPSHVVGRAAHPTLKGRAGEGVNLQRAHLMVNYDLPWNPNRLE